jgi:predicted aminopeptidase
LISSIADYLFSGVAYIKLFYELYASDENKTTENQSDKPNVSITEIAANYVIYNLFASPVDPDLSIIITTFFGPVAAFIYQGLYLGSYG